MASRDPDRERHWRSVLTQWHQSDQTIAAFCNQRHLSKPTFCYWQRKLGFGRRSKPTVAGGDVRADDARRGTAGRGRAADGCDPQAAAHSRRRADHPLARRGEGGIVLTLGFSGRILVAVESVDGRKGIDSLAGVVRSVLQGDPLSGDLFVFKNRRGDKLKILAWMGDGFALYLRRLERGTFAFPTASDASVLVTPTQLAMILGGLDPAKARERPPLQNSGVNGATRNAGRC